MNLSTHADSIAITLKVGQIYKYIYIYFFFKGVKKIEGPKKIMGGSKNIFIKVQKKILEGGQKKFVALGGLEKNYTRWRRQTD